ncbi:hypothetical protein [Aestuariimicrobium sp. T2.26MG-19.2B]|uniref:hypothetical protein n=1 Tax=Aestuariimicrobium sp. T2.26MG-19.2B TaxID=3040679 RepID=UPI0024776AA6|nr:hypothetical protein [Aestuariimicrobium sp. T2.26MG-19.2B]CAI9411559.1 hypothetical protein AESSP_02675 [Aestuariimicrobium sp. T2.26MG-19.2B]
MSDGISEMLAKRAKSTRKATTNLTKQPSPSRRMPGPRNPAPPAATQAPAATVEVEQQQATVTQPVERGSAAPQPILEDRRVTMYIAADADEWLTEASLAGRRTRVDASRSAIVRLALERLMAEMTHDQIVEELRGRAAAAGPTRGRRRL